MPRNPSTGVYSKPAGTTPSVGQVIDPVPWNALTTDLGNEITNSLPRDGSAPMVAPLKAAGGTMSAPGLGFASTPQTGLYLKGGGLLGFTQNGVDVSFDKALFYAAKSGDYTALASDDSAVHRFMADAIVTLTAAATLGANWHYAVIADGGDVTIDPNGSETIDGAATLVIPNGYSAFIVCSGSTFFTDKLMTRILTKADVANVADYFIDLVPSFVGTTSISVSSGSAFCGGKSFSIPSALTKVFTSTFVAGSNGGILDTGTIAASKTYFIYAIRRISDGTGDIVASLSSTPAGVTMTNLVGWEVLSGSRVGIVLSNASSQIINFKQWGNRLKLTDAIFELSTSGTVDNNNFNCAGMPDGISVDGEFLLHNVASSNTVATIRADTEKTSSNSWGGANLFLNTLSATNLQIGQRIRSRPDGLIWVNTGVSVGSATMELLSIGWLDYTTRRIGG
ncbi:hypothetical protein HFO42_32920 [Rhizobium leguminosarum]|uniref:Uncharacterized protein n=1 Tax=Rhizobium leguminosarum TaxID=384 RepID=A0AAJ1AGI3_RHILE|nr:hypothetical protein [Rhizobium leguminosarum]MBY5538045.1 hypothetical protein [Rhizobium leguminosarum]MBY5599028.1 hypothetical protein [Rhizobium leguminosarum]MBY5619604.1 hypothetical protein [Rhizobium leguminosarum]MBY5632832.1 hypothetical protein [Rhizobium leguminosarum]MBY5735023.1 hypothetical protein [Rhizobium leguminosarum]